jgi:superfamily II DNA or RNA helicase
MNMEYDEFIAGKSAMKTFPGIDATDDEMPPHLFDFQRDLTRWALRKGRAAVFADTGLGKTFIQIEWARRVSEHGRVLILTPLAVAQQTVRAAAQLGLEWPYARSDRGDPVIVTNYEMLHAFDPGEFVGIVLDESSILKAYTGKTRSEIIAAFADTPYRIALTATPAPNDFTELGNHAEFLGVRTRTEMLSEFFVHDGGSTQNWRLKGHAVDAFWRWVASWGAVVKRPSDLGYDDAGFALPPIQMYEHLIPMDHTQAATIGRLFLPHAVTLADQRAARRASLSHRANIAAEIATCDEPAIVWCEFNAEADAIAAAIPDAVQVAGSDAIDVKVDRLVGFSEGRYRALVTKPTIAGFGLNWQHCALVVFAGVSHSYEQTYQAIRRCWRFGQNREVHVHRVYSEANATVAENYRRKEADAERMAQDMLAHVAPSVRAEVCESSRRRWNPYEPRESMVIPDWLGQSGRGG